MRKIIPFLSVLFLCNLSCKKSDDTKAAKTPTKENLTGTYKITKIIGKAGNTAEEDVTGSWLEDCERDDLHKLNADYTYEWVDAGTQCSPEGGYTDTWSLDNANTITIDGDTYTIKSFDGKNLELLYTWAGSTASLTATYMKQ